MGGETYLDLEDPRCLAEFWGRYRELTDPYWKDRATVRAREYERYKENVRYLRQLSYRLYHCPDDPAGLFIHCDEATPGIHLTCIPYSRGCKRGPEVQAALGRAMTGMGYPSTWTDVLDENGERVPKRDKSGEVIHNADGTARYKQEPDRQGIIDWIEDQKRWIQNEMEWRYGW